MTTERVLRQIARETADYANAQVTQLEQEALELKQRTAEKEAERDAARLAPKRLADYRVTLGTDYQCPRCWIMDGISAPLRSLPGGAHSDLFACRRCNSDFTIPF